MTKRVIVTRRKCEEEDEMVDIDRKSVKKEYGIVIRTGRKC